VGIDFKRLYELKPFLDAIAEALPFGGATGGHLACCIAFETAGTIQPDICNVYMPTHEGKPAKQYAKRWAECSLEERRCVVATGLIQFTATTAQSLGWTLAQVAELSAMAQMVLICEYMRPYRHRLRNLGDLYLAIFYPAAIGKPDSYVIAVEGRKAYDQNRGLDANGNSAITRGEVIARIERMWRDHFKPCWETGTCTV